MTDFALFQSQDSSAVKRGDYHPEPAVRFRLLLPNNKRYCCASPVCPASAGSFWSGYSMADFCQLTMCMITGDVYGGEFERD